MSVPPVDMKMLSLKDIASSISAEDFLFQALAEMQRTKAWSMDPGAPTVLHQAMARWEMLPKRLRAHGFIWDVTRLYFGVGRLDISKMSDTRAIPKMEWRQLLQMLGIHDMLDAGDSMTIIDSLIEAVEQVQETVTFHQIIDLYPVNSGSLGDLFLMIKDHIEDAKNSSSDPK